MRFAKKDAKIAALAVDIHRIPQASVQSLQGQDPHLVVFLRHMGRTFCRETAGDLAAKRATLEQSGTRLLFVHMGTREQGAAILEAFGLGDVPQVSDPSAALYRAFQLDRGSFGQLFGWRSWVGGLRAARYGVGPLLGDGLQMPGVFLIHKGKVLKGYRHTVASSRPDYVSLGQQQSA